MLFFWTLNLIFKKNGSWFPQKNVNHFRFDHRNKLKCKIFFTVLFFWDQNKCSLSELVSMWYFSKTINKKKYHTDPKLLNVSVSLQLLELQKMTYVCWWLNWVALSFTRVFLYSSCVWRPERARSTVTDGVWKNIVSLISFVCLLFWGFVHTFCSKSFIYTLFWTILNLFNMEACWRHRIKSK